MKLALPTGPLATTLGTWLLLGVLSVCAAPQVKAAPCCMSAAAVGAGRLKVWEDLAVGLRSSWNTGLGYWDPAGSWRPYVSYGEMDWRWELWSLVRINRRLAATVNLPWLVSYRRVGNMGEGVGAGVADLRLGFRYDLLEVGEYEGLPALAVTGGLLVPTGRSVEAAGVPLGIEVGGRGAWGVALGAVAEKTSLPWYVRLNVELQVPLPQWRHGFEQRFGPGLITTLSGGYEITSGLVASMLTRLRWESTIIRDGRPVADSEVLDWGVGGAIAWEVTPHVTLQASLDTGVFVDGAGVNQAGRVTASLGARYGHF